MLSDSVPPEVKIISFVSAFIFLAIISLLFSNGSASELFTFRNCLCNSNIISLFVYLHGLCRAFTATSDWE